MSEYNQKLKLFFSIIVCTLIRLLPFRAPNLEPILATQMPLARAHGKYAAFFFGFTSMILYDIITMRLGLWTLTTALVYGIIGLWAYNFFKNKDNNRKNYALFAVYATLLFDITTGVIAGPVFFNQNLMLALTGQIPFTLIHLAGNIAFAYLLSPIIYNYFIKEEKIEIGRLVSLLKVKKI